MKGRLQEMIKINKKTFFKPIQSKRSARKTEGPLRAGKGNLLTAEVDTDKRIEKNNPLNPNPSPDCSQSKLGAARQK